MPTHRTRVLLLALFVIVAGAFAASDAIPRAQAHEDTASDASSKAEVAPSSTPDKPRIQVNPSVRMSMNELLELYAEAKGKLVVLDEQGRDAIQSFKREIWLPAASSGIDADGLLKALLARYQLVVEEEAELIRILSQSPERAHARWVKSEAELASVDNWDLVAMTFQYYSTLYEREAWDALAAMREAETLRVETAGERKLHLRGYAKHLRQALTLLRYVERDKLAISYPRVATDLNLEPDTEREPESPHLQTIAGVRSWKCLDLIKHYAAERKMVLSYLPKVGEAIEAIEIKIDASEEGQQADLLSLIQAALIDSSITLIEHDGLIEVVHERDAALMSLPVLTREAQLDGLGPLEGVQLIYQPHYFSGYALRNSLEAAFSNDSLYSMVVHDTDSEILFMRGSAREVRAMLALIKTLDHPKQPVAFSVKLKGADAERLMALARKMYTVGCVYEEETDTCFFSTQSDGHEALKQAIESLRDTLLAE